MNKIIVAIKLINERTNCGLKTSKELAERIFEIYNDDPPYLYDKSPEPNSGNPDDPSDWWKP